MPGRDGHETCLKLKSQVSFVSGLDTAEERLACFEAGGGEYLIKPVNEADILAKSTENLDKASVMKTVKKNANDAMKIAMQAMTSSSALVQVIHFVTATLESNALQQMAKKICSTSEAFGFTSCAMFPNNRPVYFGCKADTVEAKLLLELS